MLCKMCSGVLDGISCNFLVENASNHFLGIIYKGGGQGDGGVILCGSHLL